MNNPMKTMAGIGLRDRLRPVVSISMKSPCRRYLILVMLAILGLGAGAAEEAASDGADGVMTGNPGGLCSNPPLVPGSNQVTESAVEPVLPHSTMESPGGMPTTPDPSPLASPAGTSLSGQILGPQDAPEDPSSSETLVPAKFSPPPLQSPQPQAPVSQPAVAEAAGPASNAPSLEEIDASLALLGTGSGTKRFKVNKEQGEAVIYGERLVGISCEAQFRVLISLSRQRLYLLSCNNVVLESPIASGRKAGWTPKGCYSILEKELNHRSNKYGDLVDANGCVIRRNVVNGAKGGTFRGAPMKYFMRLSYEGVGMHAGILPGYPASHGCIRLPHEVAEFLYGRLRTKTPVWVVD